MEGISDNTLAHFNLSRYDMEKVYEKHKLFVKLKNYSAYHDKKQTRLSYGNDKYDCPCGITILMRNKRNHEHTIRHQKYIQKNPAD